MDKDELIERVEKVAAPVIVGLAVVAGLIVSAAQIREKKARRRRWFVPVVIIVAVVFVGFVGAVIEHAVNAEPQRQCLNGSYMASDGRQVCSAVYSAGIPAGATAYCNDGTYSFNRDDTSVCSRHGGVQTTL